MNRLLRGRCLVWVVANLLLALGCGLSEYQEKFARQQERMNYIDQENEYLGKPIALPKKKAGDINSSLSVFLRLPLGISTSPDGKPMGVMSHYGQVGSAKASKGSGAKASGIQDVYLAVTINKNWPDFRNEVLAPFKGSEGKTGRSVSLSAPGREPITFETLSISEGTDSPMNYQFYFFREEIYRVAIVFRGPQTAMNSESTKKAIEFSLKSLAVGDGAKEKPRSSPG